MLDAPDRIGNASPMFPIRDHNPSATTPVATRALIVANVAIFLLGLPAFQSDAALARFYADWALIPARVTAGHGLQTFFTSMFLHAGWLHLLGNMLFLWIFGDNLEDTFGHARFLLFYLLCGLAAAGCQIAIDPGSRLPMVGASGAIAGVMGGYLLLFPRARIDLLLVFLVFFRVFVVPAWAVLGLWFVLQAVEGAFSDPAQGGVAYSAHVGGFVAGLVLTLPVWLWRGGPALWRATGGQPPHPAAAYVLRPSTIPRVRRRR